jgi:hypothetical protein
MVMKKCDINRKKELNMKILNKSFILSAYVCIVLLLIISCNEIKSAGAAGKYLIIAKKEFIDYIIYNPLRYSFQKDDYSDLMIELKDNKISEEIIVNSEICVAAQNIPAVVFGIDCEQDPLIDEINMIKGDYSELKSDEIILNKKIADFFGIKEEYRVILVFKDYDGMFNTYEYSVKGIYELKIDYRIDAILDVKALNEILRMDNKITNFIIYNKNGEKVLNKIKENYADLDVFCINN